MNNDIKFLNIEWRTPYPLTNFEKRFGLHASVIFVDPNMCGFLKLLWIAFKFYRTRRGETYERDIKVVNTIWAMLQIWENNGMREND